MYRRATILSMAAGCALLGVTAAFAGSAKDLVGTWQLTANVIELNGTKSDQFGPNPHGILYFESNGRYVLSIVRDGLPKFAGNSRTKGTDAENKAVVEGSISHFGSYNVEDDKIVFTIEHATFANWDGVTQKRPYKISGEELSFFVPAASGGGTSQVSWKRQK